MEYIKAGQMRKVDKLAVNDFGLGVQKMMENTGRNVARFIKDNLSPKKVVVLYGKGNNGGGGVAAARFLNIYGVKDIELIPASKKANENLKNELKIIGKAEIKPKKKSGKINENDIILDALLGYNIKGDPRGKYASLIKWANESKAKIISLDLPSGMNPDTGEHYTTCIDADYTLTLGLPFIGFKKANRNIGRLYLVNLGIPWKLYSKLGIKTGNYFEKKDVIKI